MHERNFTFELTPLQSPSPQHHLIPKHHPGSDSTTVDGVEDLTNNCDKNGASQDKSSNIQKRPTFDSLDKRKSWSVETNTNTSG